MAFRMMKRCDLGMDSTIKPLNCRAEYYGSSALERVFEFQQGSNGSDTITSSLDGGTHDARCESLSLLRRNT